MLRVIRVVVLSVLLAWLGQPLLAQPASGQWSGRLERPGGLPVHLQFRVEQDGGGQWRVVFINAGEFIATNPLQWQGDSVWFAMPVFESSFAVRLTGTGRMDGKWTKGTGTVPQEWQFHATNQPQSRIPGAPNPAQRNIAGRWQMQFVRKDGSLRAAVGEFAQQGDRLTGTIINPSGDARYLDGAVRGDSLYLTAFDGSHSYAIIARIPSDSVLSDGLFFGGTPPGDRFSAVRRADAQLPDTGSVTGMRPGTETLDFRFPDLDSVMVSLHDARFRNKVVVIQLMGSWCPNCMDETAFLSQFYNSQAKREVEVVALAYELSTDFQRSAKSLRRFQQKFDVRYPMLITGVRSADPDKGTKTLPELTDIRLFPTTIILDKLGKVRKIHGGFYGPGAPDYHEAYKREFFETLNRLKTE
jgi:thiol-disulfide isomerase/thioredoxin